ncbi:helix-turn-helix domain-containing protein [Litorivita sp. NS0012-18]|uniref:AraC-like ligand-binding domain-containing protein n=1 Tax=Litorivita sp. NS0012-18 TaxID=3127655 RepID=UPI00310A4B82
MEVLFDTAQLAGAKRGAGWIEALCGNYVNVDAKLDAPEDYIGSIKQASFGTVNLSETLGARQKISRTRHHLCHIDKDCYYFQLPHNGVLGVRQHGAEYPSSPAMACLYSAAEPYELDCTGLIRSNFLEISRSALEARLDGALPVNRAVATGTGMGRVLADFLLSTARESAHMSQIQRDEMGDDILNLLALALRAAPDEAGESEQRALQTTRLRTIKAYIDAHCHDPLLGPRQIAAQNGISLRYLHGLFAGEDQTVSEYLWMRRLHNCYAALERADRKMSLTELAFSNGFNSSSHFSSMFRAKFGLKPSELLRRN